ncbi:hypothetical protein RJT34_33569 [Clitoria ternatea]|uniref:Uncharacterized protein n=1 Tax=Clitoria ternatea TaxID=43366 RepID=A0AAN9I3B6_CLITE
MDRLTGKFTKASAYGLELRDTDMQVFSCFLDCGAMSCKPIEVETVYRAEPRALDFVEFKGKLGMGIQRSKLLCKLFDCLA